MKERNTMTGVREEARPRSRGTRVRWCGRQCRGGEQDRETARRPGGPSPFTGNTRKTNVIRCRFCFYISLKSRRRREQN